MYFHAIRRSKVCILYSRYFCWYFNLNKNTFTCSFGYKHFVMVDPFHSPKTIIVPIVLSTVFGLFRNMIWSLVRQICSLVQSDGYRAQNLALTANVCFLYTKNTLICSTKRTVAFRY